LSILRRQSLRTRLTISFVATAAVLVTILSLATFLSVHTLLENQRIRSSTRQTIFTLVFARDVLGSHPGDVQRLASLLQSRGGFESMVTTSSLWYSTELSLTPAEIPAGLRGIVEREGLGYQEIRMGGTRTLVFGSPLPPESTDLYLFYSLEDVDRMLSLLGGALIVIGAAVVATAAALALWIARRILRPLSRVSAAARRVAEGLLDTRVEAVPHDEVGALAASFNEMASAFQEMLQRERRFVGAVSHELRTPLAALQATTEVLATHRGELSPSAREAADLVLEDVSGMRRLVEELLEISALDARESSVRWEPVELRALVRAVLDRRRLDVPIEGPEITTSSDKARLDRIVGNLVDNAFEHGGGRGVRVRIERADGWCSVAVSDEGPGIEVDDLPHIFERFYKTDRSRTRDRGGVGLGLALAKENARVIEGTLEATSVPAEGSTFTLRLPLRDRAEPETP